MVYGSTFDFLLGNFFFFFSYKVSRRAPGPIQPLTECLPGTLELSHETAHTTPASAEDKNAWRYNSSSNYAFMLSYLIEYGGKFTFYIASARSLCHNFKFYEQNLVSIYEGFSDAEFQHVTLKDYGVIVTTDVYTRSLGCYGHRNINFLRSTRTVLFSMHVIKPPARRTQRTNETGLRFSTIYEECLHSSETNSME
jgi:hypothetical protein